MILDGKALAASWREDLTKEVAEFTAQRGSTPGIVVVQVGADPASERYVRQIRRSFEGVGMECNVHSLPASASEDEVVTLARNLSADRKVNGIIVQIPLPPHISQLAVATSIAPEKDIDGINPYNAGMLMAGTGDFLAPATPSGGIALLEHYNLPISGQRAVVVGRSNIVGKPMAMLLLHRHATVTISHSRTPHLAAVTRQADILVAAVGKPRMITADMIKPGAVVIDFGVNIVDGSVVGDVDYAAAQTVAGAITPVPGGTGPMTNVMLMRNAMLAAKRQA